VKKTRFSHYWAKGGVWTVVVILGWGCASTSRFISKPGAKFDQIRSILIIEQERVALRNITDEFARNLISKGYSVRANPKIENSVESDAVLQINVSQFQPDRKYLVLLNQDKAGNSHDTLLVNPVVEVGGRSLYPSHGIVGVDNAEIVVSNAAVSLSARLLDGKTHEIIWSGSVTYEGLDLDMAVRGAVVAMIKKFPKGGHNGP